MSNLTHSRQGPFILSGICSIFIPGLGQLLKGQIGKAISFFVIVGILGWLASHLPFVFVVSGLAWLVNVLDAFFASRR